MLNNSHFSIFKKSCLMSMITACMTPTFAMQPLSDDSLSSTTGEGVAQMLFFESDEVCETSYKDRGGKYQGQTGVTLPKA